MEKSRHIVPVLQALLVTFLWSTSFVIIKLGLRQIPALTFAGLRYSLAFLAFLPFLFKKEVRDEISSLSAQDWGKLLSLGVVFYTLTQGAQFFGLAFLPSVTVSLMFNMTPLIVAIMGILLLREMPSLLQYTGSVFFLAGVLTYFYPLDLPGEQTTGIVIMSFGILANATAAVMGRYVNRARAIRPLVVTALSMGFGALLLLAGGLAFQGLPAIDAGGWAMLLWLALVNTAFAFTLWNKTLRSLTAHESSIINGTMLVQIAILSYLFLGETITWKEGAGMLLSACGVVLVQLKPAKKITSG